VYHVALGSGVAVSTAAALTAASVAAGHVPVLAIKAARSDLHALRRIVRDALLSLESAPSLEREMSALERHVDTHIARNDARNETCVVVLEEIRNLPSAAEVQ
jgi:hypothetical protein